MSPSKVNDAPTVEKIKYTPRTHTSDEYVLPSDEVERQRLDHQHRIMRRAFDNHLYLAPVTLKPGDRVLDSGTGTASWLLDFARQEPNATVYGIDISPRLFPPNPPSNVHLSTNSIIQLPADWSSTFTFVHQRFLVGGLSISAWKAALAEMHRVLVPGGWVSLFEMNCASAHMDFEKGPNAEKMMQIVDAVFSKAGAHAGAVYELDDWLKEAGFVNVEKKLVRIPMYGEEGKDMLDDAHSVYKALRTPVLKAGGLGFVQSEEEYDQLVRETRNELEHTPNARIQTFMVWGQKPL